MSQQKTANIFTQTASCVILENVSIAKYPYRLLFARLVLCLSYCHVLCFLYKTSYPWNWCSSPRAWLISHWMIEGQIDLLNDWLNGWLSDVYAFYNPNSWLVDLLMFTLLSNQNVGWWINWCIRFCQAKKSHLVWNGKLIPRMIKWFT